MKPKTPEELAAERQRKAYSLYLDRKQMDYIEKRATKAGVSASKIVDEAIAAYIHAVKDKKSPE